MSAETMQAGVYLQTHYKTDQNDFYNPVYKQNLCVIQFKSLIKKKV